MNVIPVPGEVFRTVATTIPRPRPRHREQWSPAERHVEASRPAPRGRRVARPAGWAVIEVQR